ncbi:MAG TPA: primosomal protein N' [Polyangia bacterium]|nr:primosomal protein N' [Polyangia bacterium]
MSDAGAAGTLLEVAVALPVSGTFTYRDPRPEVVAPVGAQVVVPFGTRTVTGFVIGPATPGGAGAAAKDILEVVAGEPAFDSAMIGFGRWVADYYQAPLGEVLRAALPQGEQATAKRAVRLTDLGRRALDRQGSLVADAPREPVLAALFDAGGELPLQRLVRAAPRARGQLSRLAADGLVEIGDEVARRRPPPTVVLAFADPGDPPPTALPKRAAARRTLLAKVAAAPDGLEVATLSAAERVHLRALAVAGLARVEHRPVARAPEIVPPPPAASEIRLNPAQALAVETLTAALAAGFSTTLLHGVTGSGKTEVYLRVIATARAAGRGALVLVPEIALTPQLAARFRARFGEDVAVLHSGLPPGERLAAWRRLRSGDVGIALGARSAVFAPVRALGVVVIDEEHDPSFKQEEGVRYHARDLAVVRAQRSGALAILGSATPSLESTYNVTRGRFARLSLPERATPRPLPEVSIVDLRRHPPGPDGLLSAPLAEALGATLAAGEQAILFLNRRGFSTVMLCRACGQVVRCNNCVVSMTYHRGRARLVCHYCGRNTPVPTLCPVCASPRVERLGTGTERVEAVLRERFPDARVARLDRDTAGSGAIRELDAILRRMHSHEIDLLVGTQMVTKGHDFPGVTLVGVLQPDQGMDLPDFRATERTFQLLEQVAGRAGRGERPGRVMIQTYRPDHPAITAVVQHDYDGFVRAELAERLASGYPPFTRMVALRLDAPDLSRAREAATAAADAARRAGGDAVRVRGPAEAPLGRLRGRARWQVWLASQDRAALAVAARAASNAVRPGGDLRLAVDVDPQSVL